LIEKAFIGPIAVIINIESLGMGKARGTFCKNITNQPVLSWYFNYLRMSH